MTFGFFSYHNMLFVDIYLTLCQTCTPKNAKENCLKLISSSNHKIMHLLEYVWQGLMPSDAILVKQKKEKTQSTGWTDHSHGYISRTIFCHSHGPSQDQQFQSLLYHGTLQKDGQVLQFWYWLGFWMHAITGRICPVIVTEWNIHNGHQIWWNAWSGLDSSHRFLFAIVDLIQNLSASFLLAYTKNSAKRPSAAWIVKMLEEAIAAQWQKNIIMLWPLIHFQWEFFGCGGFCEVWRIFVGNHNEISVSLRYQQITKFSRPKIFIFILLLIIVTNHPRNNFNLLIRYSHMAHYWIFISFFLNASKCQCIM